MQGLILHLPVIMKPIELTILKTEVHSIHQDIINLIIIPMEVRNITKDNQPTLIRQWGHSILKEMFLILQMLMDNQDILQVMTIKVNFNK